MKAMVPKAKMAKKAQRALDLEKRNTWQICPVPRVRESGKLYNRKKLKQERFT